MNDSIPAHLLRQRVYLLHFTQPYKHARHYLGCAEDVGARLAQHRKGTGARLTQVVREAGISWVVARTWRGGRHLEHKLKGYHSGVKLCPICQGKITIEEVLEAQPPPSGRVSGRRVPMGDGRPVRFH
jgi:predicted GIY-YIG superfamily endonuclease